MGSRGTNMRLIIAGATRLLPSHDFINDAINMFGIKNISEIVSGSANGVDTCGEFYAGAMGIPVKAFELELNKYDKPKAILNTNLLMADYADALLVIHEGGEYSVDMKLQMMRLNKPVYEIELRSIK